MNILRWFFKYFDLDNNDKISTKNLKKIAREIGENLLDTELKKILEEPNKDNDGFIVFEDFYRIMKNRGDDSLENRSSD